MIVNLFDDTEYRPRDTPSENGPRRHTGGVISSESRTTRKPRNPQRKMPEVFLRVLRVPATNVAPASIAVRFRATRRISGRSGWTGRGSGKPSQGRAYANRGSADRTADRPIERMWRSPMQSRHVDIPGPKPAKRDTSVQQDTGLRAAVSAFEAWQRERPPCPPPPSRLPLRQRLKHHRS